MKIAAIMTFFALLACGASLAAPSRAPTLTLTPATLSAGRTTAIRITTAGCPAGDGLMVISRAFSKQHEFAGVGAIYLHRSGTTYQGTARIPVGRKAGRYAVTARCGGGNLGVLRYLTVR